MKITSVDTNWANVYVGLKESYDGVIHLQQEAVDICRDYANKVGLGLTVSGTLFIYTGGGEPGVVVGLINYPRFPSTTNDIYTHAKAIAEICMEQFKQERISIVMKNKTVMIEREDDGN